jgi:protein SCO1
VKKLPKFPRHSRPWRNGALVLLVLCICCVLASFLGFVVRQAGEHATARLRPFVLVDSSGRTVTERQHPGELLLLYFGFTFCPDACPTTMVYLSRLMKALGPDAQRMQVAFVSIDPERDTPERLRGYLAAFDGRFIALGGTPAAIAAAAQSFEVVYRRTPPLAGPDTYGFDHTDMVYVIDQQGQQVTMLGTHLSEATSIERLRQHLPTVAKVLAPCCRMPTLADRFRQLPPRPQTGTP